jgi:hypothetical protein
MGGQWRGCMADKGDAERLRLSGCIKEGAGQGGLLSGLTLSGWPGCDAAWRQRGCTWAGTRVSGWRASKAVLDRGTHSVANG